MDNADRFEEEQAVINDWRQAETMRLSIYDCELWRESVTGMKPVMDFAPHVVTACYPTLWSFLN